MGGSFLEAWDRDAWLLGNQMVVGNVHDYFGLRPVFVLPTPASRK